MIAKLCNTDSLSLYSPQHGGLIVEADCRLVSMQSRLTFIPFEDDAPSESIHYLRNENHIKWRYSITRTILATVARTTADRERERERPIIAAESREFAIRQRLFDEPCVDSNEIIAQHLPFEFHNLAGFPESDHWKEWLQRRFPPGKSRILSRKHFQSKGQNSAIVPHSKLSSILSPSGPYHASTWTILIVRQDLYPLLGTTTKATLIYSSKQLKIVDFKLESSNLLWNRSRTYPNIPQQSKFLEKRRKSKKPEIRSSSWLERGSEQLEEFGRVGKQKVFEDSKTLTKNNDSEFLNGFSENRNGWKRFPEWFK